MRNRLIRLSGSFLATALSVPLLNAARPAVSTDRVHSLRAKAGQLLWVGYHSQRQINLLQPAGVVFFGWNMNSSSDLHSATQTLRKNEATQSRIPAITAMDFEGGQVMRIKRGLTYVPDAGALAATGDPKLIFAISKFMAQDLRKLGIDVNFSPVLDRGDALSFLSNRVWGSDPKRIASLTGSFLEGHLAGGTFPLPKHFPGHGMQAFQDAHYLMPVNFQSRAKLITQDLFPFEKVMFDKRFGGLMTAHVQVPALDRGPASVSKKILSDFLRTDLGYRGFLLSDDLEMSALAGERKSVGELAVESLSSGADAVLVVWSETAQREARDRIVQAIVAGVLPEAEVDAKIARAQALRLRIRNYQIQASASPELPTAEKTKLVKKAWKNSQEWIVGSLPRLRRSLVKYEKTPWKVILPSGNYARDWRQYRKGDEVIVHDARKGENYPTLLAAFRASTRGQPVVIITPPLHEDGGQWGRMVAKYLNLIFKKGELVAPMVWVHQGASPARVARLENPVKPVSLVLLHTATSIGLRHFMQVLTSEDQSWNSASPKYSLLSP